MPTVLFLDGVWLVWLVHGLYQLFLLSDGTLVVIDLIWGVWSLQPVAIFST